MDNFKIIYRILRYLEQALDCAELDPSPISHTALGITRERWEQLLIMLQNDGYINGIVYVRTLSSDRAHITEPIRPNITLKGLEYLAENSLMKKAGDLLKGAISMIK